MKPFIFAALLLLPFRAGAAHWEPLITDNFNAGIVTADLNNNLAARQDGPLAPETYSKNATFPFINQTVLQLTSGSQVWLDHNFISSHDLFRVSFDMVVKGGPANEWAGFAIGGPSTGSGVASAQSDFSVLFTSTTGGNRFLGSSPQGAFTYRDISTTNDFFRVDLVVETSGYGLGDTATAKLYVNDSDLSGAPLFTQAFSWDSQNANFMTLNASSPDLTLVDNYSVAVFVPEPSTVMLLGIGGFILARWRRACRS